MSNLLRNKIDAIVLRLRFIMKKKVFRIIVWEGVEGYGTGFTNISKEIGFLL